MTNQSSKEEEDHSRDFYSNLDDIEAYKLDNILEP